MSTAAIYVRISDDKEGRALGVARQEADCRALAAANGLTVVDVFSDNDISASTSSRKPRPAFDRMLDAAEAGAFKYVLAYSLSRLTRRPREREDLMDLHDDFGTQPWFVASGRPDLSTADGQQMFRMLGTMDTAEADRTAERARRKQLDLAQSGRHNGPRPFGWDIVGIGPDQRLVLNPAEAEVVRECVQRVLDGDGLWKITRNLNDRKIPTTRGNLWGTQVLRRVLLRSSNCGLRTHQPRRRGKASGPVALYPGQWEPIINQETYERLVAVLTNPARKTNNRGTEAKYLLTSVARCGVCDGYVVGTAEFTYTLKNGRSRTYPHAYKCPTAGCMKVQRRMADVDEHVTGVVVGVLQRDGVRLLGGDAVAADAARVRIDAIQAKLAIAADQFAEDILTGEQLKRITDRLRPQLAAEHARLAAAQPEQSLARFAGPSAADAWANADVEARKSIIRLLGIRITIHPVGAGNGRAYNVDSVTVEGAQMPAPERLATV